jgi:sulfur-oxidizing protein SoxY
MTPDIAENGAVVPIRVEVDAGALPNITKVSVLVEMNPNPLAASFDIPRGTDVYIETRVKVAQTGNLYAVVESDGQLFMASRETKVTLGGCGG